MLDFLAISYILLVAFIFGELYAKIYSMPTKYTNWHADHQQLLLDFMTSKKYDLAGGSTDERMA